MSPPTEAVTLEQVDSSLESPICKDYTVEEAGDLPRDHLFPAAVLCHPHCLARVPCLGLSNGEDPSLQS